MISRENALCSTESYDSLEPAFRLSAVNRAAKRAAALASGAPER